MNVCLLFNLCSFMNVICQFFVIGKQGGGYLPVCLSFCPSVCLSVCPSVCLSVCLPVCLFSLPLVWSSSYIYWTEWGRVPKISRRPLSGTSSPEQMYTSLKLVWPNGISIFNQKLYLVDGSTKKIYRCGLNPSGK